MYKKLLFLLLILMIITSSLATESYFIDPINGSDLFEGNSDEECWKSFKPLNETLLLPGDKVTIIAAGDLTETLKPQGMGTVDKPIVIQFAQGRYDIYREKLFSGKFHISNTNDDPNGMKKAAILIDGCKNIKIIGTNSLLMMRGKMIETIISNSENISISGIRYDYHRPTVSEFTTESVRGTKAIISVNSDSTYEIRKKKIHWMGEGWEMPAGGYFQELNPQWTQVKRTSNVFSTLVKCTEIEKNKLELTFIGKPRIKKGFTYQNRDTFRDYSAFFINLSKNIEFNDVKVHFMHGMGVVSQFSENLTFENVTFKPRKESGRSCSSWADILHFSGCKGQITVNNVVFSGANDDAINVHGTHLRIVDSAAKELTVRFMHKQTYGFQPFFPGDQIDIINNANLRSYNQNQVVKVTQIDDKNWKLTVARDLPKIELGDVIENSSWSADVHVSNCVIERIPTRGFLLSSRGKILIENNDFNQIYMSAILVADDARSWFESGMVTDLTVERNRFTLCSQPVITLHPENVSEAKSSWVHQNINITSNEFNGISSKKAIIYLKSSAQVTIMDNEINLLPSGSPHQTKIAELDNCGEVTIENNSIISP